MSAFGEYIEAKYIRIVLNTILNTIQHEHATNAELSIMAKKNILSLSDNKIKIVFTNLCLLEMHA